MTTTQQHQQDDVETRRAVDEVLAHGNLYLATTHDGRPWVSGVYFAEGSTFQLLIALETHGRTLTALRANPHAAVVVSSGRPYEPFLQGAGTIEVLDSTEDAHRALLAKVPQIEPFLQYPHEAVRLSISLWRITDVPRGWIPARTLAP
jgi:nitroimidazol reductase NimA-like FMN-containing flavoprotein (pyridoxamine 5'-phosphate oxidase superfamily)